MKSIDWLENGRDLGLIFSYRSNVFKSTLRKRLIWNEVLRLRILASYELKKSKYEDSQGVLLGSWQYTLSSITYRESSILAHYSQVSFMCLQCAPISCYLLHFALPSHYHGRHTFFSFWAHLCILHSGLICVTFRLSVRPSVCPYGLDQKSDWIIIHISESITSRTWTIHMHTD